MSDLLRAENFSLALPRGGRLVPVLHDLDLRLGRGESAGLVGESGSGKSMLALAAMRLEPADARLGGRLAFGGLDLLGAGEAELRAHRGAGAAMVFQEPMTALNPIMRVDRQVAEPLRFHHRCSRSAAIAAARKSLARVGIEQPGAWPHQLSGGQRQRAVLAIALAGNPALLIADEPTSALDVLVGHEVLGLLTTLVAERGMALLLIGHDLALMRRGAARLLVLYAGRIVEEGPTEAVLAQPAHPYTAMLVAATPHLSRGPPAALPGRMPEPGALPPGCAFAPRCPRAVAACRIEVPAMRAANGRRVACLHPLG